MNNYDETGQENQAATTASASDTPLFGYFAFHDGEWHVSNADDPCSVKLYRAALARAPLPAHSNQPELAVWYGSMPESNGKSNFTAVLHRKDVKGFDRFTDGFQFARGEYPDRVRYEADFMLWLIGEREIKPEVWDDGYDMEKHSGYVNQAQPVDDARDAARYRWLREHWFLFGTMHSRTTVLGANLHRVNVAGDVETLDVAIDANIADDAAMRANDSAAEGWSK